MYFYLIGIDYRRAPINIRDEIYRGRKAISDFWGTCDPYGSAVLVTCNRMEIYGVAEYSDDAFSRIRRFAECFPDFTKYAYFEYGEVGVFRHMVRLACGLESQIQGEKQILMQLAGWMHSVSVSPLKQMWSKAISVSRNIRVTSRLDEDIEDLAALVIDDIREKLQTKITCEIIVVGTGRVAELFAQHLLPAVHIRFAAHKHYKKAEELAERVNGAALHLDDLPGEIAGTDALICATSCPHYLINKNHFKVAAFACARPLYIYDLAIPRDVEPEVAEISGIFLQNLNDLGSIFKRQNDYRRERLELASELIEGVLRTGVEVFL